MVDRFDNVNLAQLPAPQVIEQLAFEDYRAAYIAELKSVLVDAGFDWDMDAIEADPGTAMAEATGYRELVLRGRVNDAARAVMLAFATGADLDNLAALYKVARLAGETDAALRLRTQIAPEALSVAGPRGAYVFHTLQVSPAIVDVGVHSPSPGVVHVVPLIATGDGRPDDALISAIQIALNDEYVRPLTDAVSVLKPRLVPVTINAALLVSLGPDPALVKATAIASLAAYLAARRKIGRTIYLSGIIAALTVGGVENVTVSAPLANVTAAYDQVVAPVIGKITTATLQ